MPLAVNLRAEPAEAIALRRIAALASDDFDEREAAYRALAADPRAEPTVQRHREDADPEVRQRVAKLLSHYVQTRAERAIRRGTLLLTSGQADLHPDLMRTFQQLDSKHLLHGAFVLMISDLSTREKAFAKRGHYKPSGFVLSLGTGDSAALFRMPSPFVFRHIRNGYFRQSSNEIEVLILSGDAYSDGGFEYRILLAEPTFSQRIRFFRVSHLYRHRRY